MSYDTDLSLCPNMRTSLRFTHSPSELFLFIVADEFPILDFDANLNCIKICAHVLTSPSELLLTIPAD